MTRTRVLLAAALLMALAGSVKAADLVTSPVSCGGRFFGCIVQNLSDKPLNLTIETQSASGTATVSPGSFSYGSAPCSGVEFCRFGGGSKRTMRGSYCVSATIGGPCDVVGDAR